MKNIDKIENAVEPVYEQLERLGQLHEDSSVSWSFLKVARKTFAVFL